MIVCKKCGRENLNSASFCSSCGALLSDASSPLDKITTDLEKLQKELETEMQSATNALTADLTSKPTPPEERKQVLPANIELPTVGIKKIVEENLKKTTVHPQEYIALFVPEESELKQSTSFVLNSPLVLTNLHHTVPAEYIQLIFAQDDNEVNAYAAATPGLAQEESPLLQSTIVFKSGLASASCLGAAAFATYIRGKKLGLKHKELDFLLKSTFHGMGNTIVSTNGSLSPGTTKNIFEETVEPLATTLLSMQEEHFVRLAKSLRFSAYMSIIAHEVGHIVYGHTLGKELNFEVKKAWERDADSFASQVISTCAYQEYHFLGQLLVDILFTWEEYALKEIYPEKKLRATSHPLSRERFENAIQSLSQTADQASVTFGLTADELAYLLPPE